MSPPDAPLLLLLAALCVGRVSSEEDNSSSVADYDYDADVSHNTFYWEELIPPLVVYGVTLVLGIAGNVLIIFTISRYRRLKSTTNVFLASLASADLLLIIFCIPVKVAKLFSYTWGLGFFLCKLVHYMQNVSTICSVLTLTAMSIERYYAIVHPMRAKYVCTISQARRIIICIWFASFILAVPILVVQVLMPVGMKIPAFWCVRDWESGALWRYHELYMLLLILVVPTLVMAGTYSAICWEVWHVMQRRYDMTGGHARTSGTCRRIESMPLRYKRNSSGAMRESVKKANAIKAEEDSRTVKQVIKMLVAVVVLFVICWAPMLIDNVLTAFQILPHLRLNGLKHMATAFHLMAYFNSCINPIVYGFMSRNFRDSFYKALCRCCYRSSSIMKRQPSVSHTRTTSVRYTIDTSFGRRVSISTSAY